MDQTMTNSCIVLEGGGMRSAFTSGVLEYFLEKKIFISTGSLAYLPAPVPVPPIFRDRRAETGKLMSKSRLTSVLWDFIT